MVNDMHILALSYQESIGRQLADAIRAAGIEEVLLTSSVRETLMALSQRPYDLVIVPAEDPSQQIRALKSIRPELNVALLLGADKQVIPSNLENEVLGVLHPAHLESQMPLLLARVKQIGLNNRETVLTASSPRQKSQGGLLEVAMRDIEPGDDLLQVVLSKDTEVLACEGQLPLAHAQAVAGQTSKSWDKNSESVQIQFLEMNQENDAVLLYTRPVGSLLLTLVAKPGASISDMRRQADQIAARLARSKEYRNIRD